MTLGKTDTPLGAFYRRKRAPVGAPKAVTARKLACLVYRLIKEGQGYLAHSELRNKDQICAPCANSYWL